MHELDRTWKVGELARATGLTIRALHHYDEVGLLVPQRSEAGHRVYSAADVERLYRILALRRLGMALEEIAAVLDGAGESLIETVRRHVALVERELEHGRRLLDRLRELLGTLERADAPTVEEVIGTVEAMTVVEATIEDVVTREPWEATFEFTGPCVVLLREAGGGRLLPIWIGWPEAHALAMQRRGARAPRPTSPDVTAALLDAVGARVERVVVERLHDSTYFATITVSDGGEPREVDARPSDALNLALRCGAPILVAGDLVESAGVAAWPAQGEAGEERAAAHAPGPAAAGGEGSGGRAGPSWRALGDEPAPRARRPAVGPDSPPVLRRAAARARELGHGSVGAPHLLLGILSDAGDPAAALLARHGVTSASLRASLEWPPCAAPDRPTARGLTRRAMFAMHRAAFEARRLAGGSGDRPRRAVVQVEAMHVLLAIVDSPDATGLLGLGGEQLRALRADVRAALGA